MPESAAKPSSSRSKSDRQCGEFEVPGISMASAFRNFKFENHTRIYRLASVALNSKFARRAAPGYGEFRIRHTRACGARCACAPPNRMISERVVSSYDSFLRGLD